MGVLRFIAKATLAGGIIYYSIQQGLWSNSENSVKLYGRIYNNVARLPYFKDNIPQRDVNELPPSTNNRCNSVKSSWNKGVIISIKFLSEVPTHVTNGTQNLSKIVGQYVRQQSVSEKRQ